MRRSIFPGLIVTGGSQRTPQSQVDFRQNGVLRRHDVSFVIRNSFIDRAVHIDATRTRARRCRATLRTGGAQKHGNGDGKQELHDGAFLEVGL
jgi:hypothetical protein